MKSKFILVVFLIHIVPWIAALQARPQPTLARLIEMGLERNPEIKMYTDRVKMVEMTIPQRGSWPDPVISVGVMSLPVDTWRLDMEPMTQKTVELMQMVPFFGKRALSESMARSDHQSQQFVLTDTRLQLINEIRSSYYDLYYLERRYETIRQNKALLADFARIVDIKYRAGEGIQQDVLRSQLEMMELEKVLIDLDEEMENRRNQIARLLDYPEDLQLRDLPSPEDPSMPVSLDSLQNIALRGNPQLAGAGTRIERGKTSVALARREYWPDFSISLSYGQRIDRPDFFSGMVSVSVPLFAAAKQSMKVQEEQAATSATENEYRAISNQVRQQVALFYDRMQRDHKLFDLYKNEILPQARQALESAIAAYRADKVDFSTLLINQVALLNHETEFHRILASYHQNRANLALVCGVSTEDELQ